MSSIASTPVPCGPCTQEKMNTNAYIWCYNCNEGLCRTCSGHHKKFGSTRDHKTIDIQTYKSYNPSIGAIKTKCDAHDQQFNLYCPSHLMPCCDECVSTHHSNCTGIKSLSSVVEKTKIEHSKSSLEKDIKSILQFLNTAADKKTSNIQKGKQQYENVKRSIGKVRTEINKHLDFLENNLCKEADTVWCEEKAKLSGFITEIEEKKKSLIEIQGDLHSVKVNTSKLQSFLGMHQIEQIVYQCQQYIEENDISSEYDINIEQNDEIEKILCKLKSLKSFGEVIVVKSKITKNRETSVKREAQVELQEQSSIFNMTMDIKKQREISIKKTIISDMICLMNGRLIEVEWLGNVNLFTSDFKLQKQLPLSGEAFNVTQINRDTIAITYPNEGAIKIYDMKIETVTKVITLSKCCYGLSCFNTSLAVGLNKDEIRIIDLEGNAVKSIQVESGSFLNNIVYCNYRVIFSDYCGKAVTSVDESGKQTWQYKQDLSGPWGLCTDTCGNIIVADCESGRIIVISKDGQGSKELINQNDDLKFPRSICFCNNGTSGFICDKTGRNMAKFNISYE